VAYFLRCELAVKAIVSLSKIGEILPQAHLEEHFMALVRRLAKGDWFTSRTSASGLMVVPYRRAHPALRQELLQSAFLRCHIYYRYAAPF